MSGELDGRGSMGRAGRKVPASAGSRRTLHPAGSVFQSTVRPSSGAAGTQRRASTLKSADDVKQQTQVKQLTM